MNWERVAIVGTAPSWIQTPWDDPRLTILGLNDGYHLEGFKRADAWYDLHPLDKFFIAPQPPKGKKPVVYAHTVPLGWYVRPHGHLDWLATQQMPVFLNPDHVAQLETSATWPSARAFPKAEIEAYYGRYFTSSPMWMLAHALMQGAREVHVYGIHLSTESEYIEQRPGFEFLCGCLLGRGKRNMTVTDGIRRYESPDGLLYMPAASPVLAANHQYAFEPSPRRALDPLKWNLHKAEVKRDRVIEALKKKSPYSPWTRFTEPIPDDPDGKTRTHLVATSTLQQQLYYYEALVADCHEEMARLQHMGF